MSSINKGKYKVVLYQVGLGSQQDFFNETFRKIKTIGGKHIVFVETGKLISNSYLDMSKFDSKKGYFYGLNTYGYKGKSTSLTKEFDEKIVKIIDTLKENPNKILHVKTSLTNSIDYDDGFDSIDSQKVKLEYIISAIQSYDINVEISLVGHSQGGLVNIETAIDIPNSIINIVSIGTPYSSVSVARNLFYIDSLIKLFDSNGGFIVSAFGEESTKRFVERVDTLSSSSYFSDLNNRWDKLPNRPELMVITGTSGHVTRTATEWVNFGTTSMEMSFEKKYPFDGLVLTYEQKAISHDYEVDFTYSDLPCYSKKNYLNKSCGGMIYDRCKGCNAPYYNGFNSVFNIAMEKIIENPGDSIIVKSIMEGVYRTTLTDKSMQNYYDIYASDFSHMYLSQYDPVIATILGFVE